MTSETPDHAEELPEAAGAGGASDAQPEDHDPNEPAAEDGGRAVPAVSDVSELGGASQTGSGEDEADGESEQTRRERLLRGLESIVFVSDRIVTAQALGKIVKLKASEVKPLMAELISQYADRGVQLVEVGGGYQFRSAPACAEFVREMVAQKPVRLTRAQLETLALVSYRQPITRPEIDDVRGVDTGSAVKVLLDRGLIKMLGRKDEAGRPMLYGTTPYFLEFFGLKTLRDLPTLKEFADLTEENRTLFKRKTGESVEQAEAELAERSTDDAGPDADTSDVMSARGDDDAGALEDSTVGETAETGGDFAAAREPAGAEDDMSVEPTEEQETDPEDTPCEAEDTGDGTPT